VRLKSLMLGGAVALAAGASASAGDLRDFCADRPGKATPACILDVGRLQLETGLVDAALQRGGGERDDVYTIGQTEIRYGITSRTELEAVVTPWSVERGRDASGSTRRSGFGDLALGFRTALTDPDGKGAQVSFQGFVSAPTGTHHQGAGDWEGGARLPISTDLGGGFSLGLTPEIDLRRDGDTGGRHLAFASAVSVGHPLGPLSVGAELWAEADEDPGGHANAASFDLTAAWMAGTDLQLDAGLNAGLTHDTPDLEVYVGIARRF
jgi:hypothetical protein